jgi:hypothetical protein
VTGDFNYGFAIKFVGVDGNKDQPQLQLDQNTLQVLPSTPVTVTINTGTQGSQTVYDGKLSVKYWNGSAFTAFESLIDETEGLSKSGWIQFEEKGEWKKCKLSDAGIAGFNYNEELYIAKIELDEDLDGIELEAIKLLLSDDNYLKKIHPDIMQYLPKGKNDFFDQHELSKDYIVNKMIREGVIAYEEQIKDVSQWRVCASYLSAVMILDPIAGDERLIAVRDRFEKKFEDMYLGNIANIDSNQNEVLDDYETDKTWTGTIGLQRR